MKEGRRELWADVTPDMMSEESKKKMKRRSFAILLHIDLGH